MNEFWYRIRRGAMYTASLLPFKVLYAISDLIYFIAYHIIRYRRRVVAKNLRNSFPEKGADELRAIEKRFYHSFCDRWSRCSSCFPFHARNSCDACRSAGRKK